MDHDTPLQPHPTAQRPPQCTCGVALRPFRLTGQGSARRIAALPTTDPAPIDPAELQVWAISAAAVEDWCAGGPTPHAVTDAQSRLLRWADYAPPPGSRTTCPACGTTDLPYLYSEGVCDVCAAYGPLILECTGYAWCDTQGTWTPQGPRPAQQLNAVLLDYAIQPNAVLHILPGAGGCTNGSERSSLIALLTVRRHVARHILHHLAAQAG